MRIVSGSHKGRVVRPPKFFKDRPTTDMAKEALFNIINNSFVYDEIRVLDLFSGTGSIAFEFASRGCNDIICVDKNYKYTEFIKRTALDFEFNLIKVIKYDVFKFIEKSNQKFDVIFADPPYDLSNLIEIPNAIFTNNLLADNGLLIVEHPDKISFNNSPNINEHRNYSRVNFSFFSNKK